MQELENLTDFAALCLPTMSLNGRPLALVVIAGTYTLPAPGTPQGSPSLVDDQPAVPLGPTHRGDPSSSSLIWEGQAIPGRPSTDIYVDGEAWTPAGRPAGSTRVGLRIGPRTYQALVFGDRRWRLGGIASTPESFVSMPLVYERCFGGLIPDARGQVAAAAARNPIGRGLHVSMAAARSQLLANIEDPRVLVRGPLDRPAPQGFGPIMPGWMPRRALAGTYSEQWVKTRAPLWPRDVEPSFFMAAAPGLRTSAYLEGGETLVVHGMHPDGDIVCELPSQRLVVKFEFSERSSRVMPVLDALMVAPSAMTLTMIWRATTPTIPSFLQLEGAVVRQLESWEAA